MTTAARSPQALAVVPVPGQGADAASRTLRGLFDMHAGYVWNTLRRLGVPTSDLEDMTHEVFLRVYTRLEDYDPSRPVRPWLFAFAFRVASLTRRKAYRRKETSGEPDLTLHPGPLPEEQLLRDERRRLVLAALQGIALERRAVFVLHELDETPMPEIAAALGIPVNTAYSRLRVARAEFAAAVKRLEARTS